MANSRKFQLTLRSRKIFLWTQFVLFASCSFNGIYLQPLKFPSSVKGAPVNMKVNSETDTFKVRFDALDRQPMFFRKNGDTLPLSYSIEAVTFKNSRGTALNGWFLKPKNQVAKVTLLHIHGNGGFLLSYLDLMAPFVKRGFQVFMFDYSGFGFSEGKAIRKNVLDDAVSAFDYMKERSDVRSTKLVVYGQSFGGHLSVIAATKRQNEIAGLVVEGAFSSHKDIAARRVPLIGRMLAREMYSAKKTIRDFHKPLLVIHSAEDEIIPFKMGKTIFVNANEPKQFYEVKHHHIMAPKFYADSIVYKINGMLQ
jgi:alpha-beta hydrolase superfamily lysophospholipase